MSKKKVFRVLVRPEIELLVVGETESIAIDIAKQAAKGGDADFEVSEGWKKMSWRATPISAISELRPDETMSLPWGGENDELVERYLGECRCKHGCRCND